MHISWRVRIKETSQSSSDNDFIGHHCVGLRRARGNARLSHRTCNADVRLKTLWTLRTWDHSSTDRGDVESCAFNRMKTNCFKWRHLMHLLDFEVWDAFWIFFVYHRDLIIEKLPLCSVLSFVCVCFNCIDSFY